MNDDTAHLLDILSSARLANGYVEDVAREDFMLDTKLQDSVIRRLEIVGEAAGRLSQRFRQQTPGIPWAEIRGMRNRMIHRYDDVDMDIVWETVTRDIPRLIPQLESLVPPETG